MKQLELGLEDPTPEPSREEPAKAAPFGVNWPFPDSPTVISISPDLAPAPVQPTGSLFTLEIPIRIAVFSKKRIGGSEMKHLTIIAEKAWKIIEEQVGVSPRSANILEKLKNPRESETIGALLVGAADSLDQIEIIMALEDEFGIEIDDVTGESWWRRRWVDALQELKALIDKGQPEHPPL